MGYKSPNEKLNIAGIGAGGQPFSDLCDAEAGVENVVALADVDWVRGERGFSNWPKAAKYKDFRQMLDKQGKDIDAVVIGTPDHMHATCALACMQLGKHVYVEKPLTRTSWEARLLAQAAEKYKVATQMGNQGYSHDATRVACEILWSGEIGEVREVHAWVGRPGWPQGMQKIPGATPVPDTLDWDLWLGGAAASARVHAGETTYRAVRCRAATGGRSDGRSGRRIRLLSAVQLARVLRFRQRAVRRLGRPHSGSGQLGAAVEPAEPDQRRVHQEGRDQPLHLPAEERDQVRVRRSREHAAGDGLLERQHQGDAYLPPGMTAEEARKIPAPARRSARSGAGRLHGRGGRGCRAASAHRRLRPTARRAPAASGYNCIFVGSKGYLGTSGRGEGVGLLPGSRVGGVQTPQRIPLPRRPEPAPATTIPRIAAIGSAPARAARRPAPNFSIAGPYTEWLVLGAVATHDEGKLLWDNARMEFTNNQDANKWVKPTFRKGWDIKL